MPNAYLASREPLGSGADSMNYAGNCHDTAVVGNLLGAPEEGPRTRPTRPETHDADQAAIFEFIEVLHWRIRISDSLGYVSPETFEAAKAFG